jgi:hypothetical protein
LIDEAFSLLVTVASIPEKEVRDTYEAIWVLEEDEELKKKRIPGFAPLYRELREHVETQYGKLDSISKEIEQQAWIERALNLGKSAYSSARLQMVSAKHVRKLGYYLLSDMLHSRKRSVLSEFESLQSLLTLQMLDDDPIEEVSTQYFWCDVQTIKQEPHNYKVELGCTQLLTDLICTYGGCEQFTAKVFAGSMIFIEVIRHQICQGVGVRCPFWDGKLRRPGYI